MKYPSKEGSNLLLLLETLGCITTLLLQQSAWLCSFHDKILNSQMVISPQDCCTPNLWYTLSLSLSLSHTHTHTHTHTHACMQGCRICCDCEWSVLLVGLGVCVCVCVCVSLSLSLNSNLLEDLKLCFFK